MQDKQKVTLYLPSQMHRRLKIKSVVDEESMSALVERAIQFYLQYPEAVEEIEAAQGQKGQSHRVHACPDCGSALVQRDGDLISLRNQPSIITDELTPDLSVEKVRESLGSGADSQDEEHLVPC
ncbi:hypothetical protein [Spirulina sp. CCNP1310]|uniref:hypothetical protein n=1 Tax=Spirulina sp. CCNP1310 TaxID=3110249 RepID=UPI003A4C6F63